MLDGKNGMDLLELHAIQQGQMHSSGIMRNNVQVNNSDHLSTHGQ